MEKQNKTQKSKTAKVAKTKERRISNKKVESLHKYWEAFPGLKRRLIHPVEGENYSLIKPKNVEKAVYSNASVKKYKEWTEAITSNIGESLVFSLNHNKEDFIPEMMKHATKRNASIYSYEIPFINRRKALDIIERFWPLAEEYRRICMDEGIMACKKHPLFIKAMKCKVANEMEKEVENKFLLSLYNTKVYVDLIMEKRNYTSLPGSDHSTKDVINKLLQDTEETFKEIEETVTSEVEKRIKNLDVFEFKECIILAFFHELSVLIEVMFDSSLKRLIHKLS